MGYHLRIEPFCTSRLGTYKHCQNVKVRKVEHVECLTADWIHKNRSVACFKPCMMMITTPWFLMMSSSFIFQSWLILVSPGLHASPKASFFGCFLCFWMGNCVLLAILLICFIYFVPGHFHISWHHMAVWYMAWILPMTMNSDLLTLHVNVLLYVGIEYIRFTTSADIHGHHMEIMIVGPWRETIG